MRGERILERILPEAGDVSRLRIMAWLDTNALRMTSIEPDPIRRLAALLDTDEAGASAVAERLRLSNREHDRLARIGARPFEATPEADAAGLRRALRNVGTELVRDLVLLSWAGELAASTRRSSARTREWTEMLEDVDSWNAPEFPLKGRDALDLGIAEGPEVGRALKVVEDWWEDSDYRPDREACLARLRASL